MATYTYTTTGPSASITITTSDTLSDYDFGNGTIRQGYAITDISGTIDELTITGLLSQGATSGNPSRASGILGKSYNNIFWDNSTGGNLGYSYFGLDDQGLGFTTTGGKYLFFSTTNSNFFRYGNRSGGYGFSSASSDAPCYVTGTGILTERGEVAVEHLTVGDLAVTASGEARAIRWIGSRAIKCQGRADALPIRIAAHAFGEGRPSCDLFVSPAHAIAVDVLGEVLIPACRLINGTTITQVDVEEVTYWHVELDSHDILLAEGLPAESYLDCGNRRFFANADATDLLAAPDARPEGLLSFCRPFYEAGPLVDLVRARLQDRAEALGWRKVDETFAGLHLVADGHTIRPDVDGLTARFVLPADARDVRLVSATSVPAHVVSGSTDDRRLGVPLAALTGDDGLTGARTIALDDARLGEGFHATEGGSRWTDGKALLPADLWAGCKGLFFLRVTLAGPALPRWIAPGETAGVVNLADRRKA